MAVKIKLAQGAEIVVAASLDEMAAALSTALEHGELLKVENGNGKLRVVNPQQVVYVEIDEPTTAEEPSAREPHERGSSSGVAGSAISGSISSP